MAQDFETVLKDLFGDSLNRLNQFQQDQVKRLTDKLQEVARDAVKDELQKMHAEIGELRARLIRLEQERAQGAAESLDASF